ncbi:MAG: hypothetical protein QOE03_1520 [Micromonosporaceae bacterium]|jgi:uncharacterized membrane protein|nr:hypothetical protein [Micromonosporaceae bacterium]
MFTVDVSCVVDRPLRQVFDYVADFRNAPGWQPQLDSVRLDGGPFPRGSQVVEVHHFLGVRVEAVGDLVDWRPPDGFTVRGRSRLLRVESRYTFTSEPAGTRTALSLTMDPRGPSRLVEPVLRRQLGRSLAESFANLGTTLRAALTP